MALPSTAGARRGGFVKPWVRRILSEYPEHDGGIVHHIDSDAWRGVYAVTIHDLSPFILAGRRLQRPAYRLSVRRAPRVIVTTKMTMAAIHRLIPVSRGKTFVVPVPHGPVVAGRGPELRDALWIGATSQNKNAMDFVRLAARNRHRRFAMRCSDGDRAETEGPKIILSALRLGNIELLRHDLREDEMDTLYRTSRVCVSTSSYEGWHAPIMEAYLRGCGVLLPDIPPYTEIYPRDAAFWYRPGEGDSMDRAFGDALSAPTPPPVEEVERLVSYENVGAKLVEAYGW
ncbi:MAG: hypothetical protein WCB19_05750 [Thermoplasmata archaeon]